MKSEFENWYSNSKDKSTSSAFAAGWMCQQSKIDKLQANFDQHDQWLGQRNKDVQELSDIIAKHAAEKDELQKRVDALIQKYKDEDRELKLIDEWEKSQIYGLVASQLEQALKGESNG